jgi:hypothetical protein
MKKIIAYKVFNPDWTCKGFKFEVGEIYIHQGRIKICELGFHACLKLVDCFNYYSFDSNNKVALVHILGNVEKNNDDSKICTDKIKIVKELTWFEILELVNIGDKNTGYWNSGDKNSGDKNSGDKNSGRWNSGDMNSGDMNSGDKNSGDCNSGDYNSGDCNSGYRNSGDRNSGYRNSGCWNSSDHETGYFNSQQSDIIRVFNKPCKREVWENAKKPSFIYFNLCDWIIFSDMSDEEKIKYPKAESCGKYLKTLKYKEAWQLAYSKATEEDIELLKALPNFDADVFFEITGIEIQ